VLAEARPLLGSAQTALPGPRNALANVTTMARYLAPRSNAPTTVQSNSYTRADDAADSQP
jgi:hypothetical protein